MAEEPSQIRREIEETRAEISETVDAPALRATDGTSSKHAAARMSVGMVRWMFFTVWQSEMPASRFEVDWEPAYLAREA